MNNHDVKLLKLLDIIRKDTGINNAIDAMEQLSLLLILQYFYEVILVDTPRKISIGRFKELFHSSKIMYSKNAKTDFSELKAVLHEIISSVDSIEDNLYEDRFTHLTWSKIEDLLNSIPLKIRSIKILSVVLSELDILTFDQDLAKSYDSLVVKMINESISSGAFHTPTPLVSALVKVIDPLPNQTIYDPALGTGRFLIEAEKNIHKNIKNDFNQSGTVTGQDISPFACLVGSLNLLLNNIDIGRINLGDSLLNNDNSVYDIVLSGIPFGKVSNIDLYEYEYYGYSSNLEAMFLKHSMRKLALNGKAALIVPEGLLFNSSRELLNLRHELLTKFNLHTILSLPNGTLAPYAGSKLSVLFFDNSEPEDEIWFYSLQTDKPLNKSNKLKDSDFESFVKTFSKRQASENSALISKNKILRDKNLNLSLELPNKNTQILNVNISDEIKYLAEAKIESGYLFNNISIELEKINHVNFKEKFRIKDLFKMKAGTALNKAEINNTGKYDVYGGNGTVGRFDECNRVGENIIIGRVGALCGNVHYVDGPIWVTSNSFTVDLYDKSKVYIPYLAHVLEELNLNSFARGSAQPSISYEKIKEIEFSLPTYEDQVSLTKWFKEIQLKRKEYIESLDEQINHLNRLTDFVIRRNSIDIK